MAARTADIVKMKKLRYCQPVYILLIFANCCNAGQSWRRRQSLSGRSTGSHDLLQWAVGLQQQRPRRKLFMPTAEVEVSLRRSG